ncbi:MAG: hypothetical protein O3C23_00300 [bacterium]|nr:hypothetical protein [bacterium]
MEKLIELLSVINNPGIQQSIAPLQWVFGIFGIFLVLFSIYILTQTMWLNFLFLFDFTEFFTFRPYGLRRMARRWRQVLLRLESGNEAEYKLAVVEVDDMLSSILLRMGFRGETLGDQLKILTPAIVPNLLEVAEAHQVRNNVVHDPDYRLTLEEAQRTLTIYQVTFSNLDLI